MTIKAKRDVVERVFLDVIKQGIRSGEFRNTKNQGLVCYGVLGMVHWAHEWYRPNKFGSIATVADTFATMILEGLADDGTADRLISGL